MREPRNPISTEAKYLAAILDELRKLNQIIANQSSKTVQVDGDTGKKSKPGSGKVEMKEPASEKQASSSPKQKTKKKSK